MTTQIRPAVRKDCASIYQLIKELAEYEKAPEEVTLNFRRFCKDGFGKNKVWKAFVAEKDGVVIGFALYYIRYSTWKGQCIYLEDLLVTESERRNGIGKLLMDALIKFAKKKNYPYMVWQVLEWNEPAINFYKKYEASFDYEWVNCRIGLQ